MAKIKLFWINSIFLVLTLNVILAVDSGNILISKDYINILCVNSCHDSAEKLLSADCERGCRFFDYAQISENDGGFNETAVYSLCLNSCEEAYSLDINKNSCISGCGKAKCEIQNVVEALLEEADKRMNFVKSLFDIMRSTIWSPNDDDETHDLIFQNQEFQTPILKPVNHVDYLDNQWIPKNNELDSNISKDEVEIISMMGSDMGPAESTLCATRMWLHRLSFILIVMGSMSLLFISFFYLLAFIKHKQSLGSHTTQDTASSIDMSSPPSYETLVKGGFIILSKHEENSIPSDKDGKPFLA